MKLACFVCCETLALHLEFPWYYRMFVDIDSIQRRSFWKVTASTAVKNDAIPPNNHPNQKWWPKRNGFSEIDCSHGARFWRWKNNPKMCAKVHPEPPSRLSMSLCLHWGKTHWEWQGLGGLRGLDFACGMIYRYTPDIFLAATIKIDTANKSSPSCWIRSISTSTDVTKVCRYPAILGDSHLVHQVSSWTNASAVACPQFQSEVHLAELFLTGEKEGISWMLTSS